MDVDNGGRGGGNQQFLIVLYYFWKYGTQSALLGSGARLFDLGYLDFREHSILDDIWTSEKIVICSQ